jgi:NitT/TauT family transport system permease protein
MRHINRHPPGHAADAVLLPFVLLIAAWFIGSAVRLEANPQDKLLPGLQQMLDAFRGWRSPRINAAASTSWADTLISLAAC